MTVRVHPSSNIRFRVGGLRGNPIHSSWLAVLTDPVRLGVLGALCALGVASASELCELTHTSDRTLRRHLDALVVLGLIEERDGCSDGLTPGRPAVRFAVDAGVKARLDALFSALREPLAP